MPTALASDLASGQARLVAKGAESTAEPCCQRPNQANKKPRSFRSGVGSGGQLIGKRSEVTGDAEAAGETVADAVPIDRNEYRRRPSSKL